MQISIHTPTKGATIMISIVLNCCKISIHTPTKGATSSTYYVQHWQQDFNPHSHEGSDTKQWEWSLNLQKFQSTLPRRERRQQINLQASYVKISIHTPTKGATSERAFLSKVFSDFNPHSHEGSDNGEIQGIVFVHRISIHTPTKGATLIDIDETPWRGISIHTPTKGATTIESAEYSLIYIFQSTLPRRERQGSR